MRALRQLRGQSGQLAWFLKEQARPEVWRRRRVARRGITVSGLGRHRRRRGQVWAVTMVRDEADVIGLTIDHLLAQGVDHVLVADNLSVDGTSDILRQMASRDPRVHLALDDEPAYHQAEKMTRLARLATRAGADWIVPFDADEFWLAEGATVAEHLRQLADERPQVGIVKAAFHNAIPTGGQPLSRESAMVLDASAVRPGKVAVRAHPLMTLSAGNHGAARVGAVVEGLYVVHVAYRDPGQVARKLRQGAAAVSLTDATAMPARHWRAGAQLTDHAVAAVWDNLVAGRGDERISFRFAAPLDHDVRPLTWRSWDPCHRVPAVPAHSMYDED